MSITQITSGRLAATLALTLGLGLASSQAQTQSGSSATTAPGANQGTATTGAAVGTRSGTAAKAMSGGDRRFAEDAATDGLAEVALGKLAQERAGSAEVRQYGQRMVTDHSKSNQELMALASERGLNLPEKPTAAQQRMHDKLAKEQGTDFDKAYMSHMQGDHRKAVSLFEKQAKSGDDAALKAFAQKTLPTLQEHHKLANTVHDSVKQKPSR